MAATPTAGTLSLSERPHPLTQSLAGRPYAFPSELPPMVPEKFIRLAARRESHRARLPMDLDLAVFTPAPWLSAVEERIRNSIVPVEYGEVDSPEYLNEDAGSAALSFFRNNADLLPVEPHLYGTHGGDLVAEFETALGRLTAVIAPTETVLYAVVARGRPVAKTIKRGSNRLREELKAVTQLFAPRAHGEMEPR